MLDGDTADVSCLIQVEQRIFVEIPGFHGGGGTKFYVQSIGVLEIGSFDGLNDLSKKALRRVCVESLRSDRRHPGAMQYNHSISGGRVGKGLSL